MRRIGISFVSMLSTEPAGDAVVDALWETEIVRRIDLLDRGATERHPAAEVFAELDRRLGQ